MPASKLYANYSGVTVTPNGGSAIPITEVTDVSLARGSNLKPFYGDNRRFARMLRAFEETRGVSITSGDLNALRSIPPRTPCTVAWVFEDAANGTGSGALQCSLANAVLAENPLRAQNNEYGESTVSFQAFSPDGVDPLTITVVS